MKREFTTREMVLEDVPRVREIEIWAALSTWNEEHYVESLANHDSINIVSMMNKASERVVGFVIGKFVDHEVAEIYNIGVRKELQGRGVGRVLLESFINKCLSREVKEVWLEVRERNKRAISFYEDFGFEPKYSRPRFYSKPTDNALVMFYQASKQEKTCQ